MASRRPRPDGWSATRAASGPAWSGRPGRSALASIRRHRFAGTGRRTEDALPAFVVVPHSAADPAVVERLSPGDRGRLASLAHDADLERAFLAGRTALFAAAARLGVPDLRVDAPCPDCGLSHGRPVALGGEPIHLALAHAAGAAYAIAARVPVGIDAEATPAAPERIAAIDTLAPGRGDALRRWTAIEAVLKADGRGLRVAPEAVGVRRGSARLDGVRYRLRTTLDRDCIVTVAERRPRQWESDGSRV